MASKIIARPNQSMQDLVLMACGTLDGAMDFCVANGVRVSDVPVVGTTYTIPDGITSNKDILRQLQRSGTVIGTLDKPPSVLVPVTGWRVLLDPRMLMHIDPGPGSEWTIVLSDGGPAFVNYHPLQFDFDVVTNPVLYQSKTDYEVHNLPFPRTTLYTPQISKTVRWHHTSPMLGGAYISFSDLDAPIKTCTWRDMDNNTAIYAPLMLTKNPAVCDHLIAQLDVLVASMSTYDITFNVRWLHPAVSTAFPNFIINGFDWLGTALEGTPTFGIPDCIDLTLPVGKYTLGAVTHYVNDDASVNWPDSYKTMVIEVY